MIIKADLVQKEVDSPHNRWCASGHEAPLLYRRNGPKSPQEPTKFFEVNINGNTHGIFCEPCLVVAHYVASKIRKG